MADASAPQEPSGQNEQSYTPEFGSLLGLWYPLIWRVLGLNRFFSPSMWLPVQSGLAIDLYLAGWWLIEIVSVLSLEIHGAWTTCLGLLVCFTFLFRLVDILFVVLSLLLKGFYRDPRGLKSTARLTLLTMFNALEIMFLFGALYRGFALRHPNAARFNDELAGLFDAMYPSVVTATTLGYGELRPIGWLSRLFAMGESCLMLLVVVVLIGFLRQEGWRPPDLERRA